MQTCIPVSISTNGGWEVNKILKSELFIKGHEMSQFSQLSIPYLYHPEYAKPHYPLTLEHSSADIADTRVEYMRGG